MKCLWASDKKKIWWKESDPELVPDPDPKKKIWWKESDPELVPDPDPLVRATDSKHWLELYTGKYLYKDPVQLLML